MKDDVIRISMIGGSGCGKTSFLSGVIQSMVASDIKFGTGELQSSVSLNAVEIRSSSNFFVEDDEDSMSVVNIKNASQLDEYLLSDDPDGTNGGFINSTTDSMEFLFELIIDNTVCCHVAIADYAGELIDNPNNEAMKSNLQQLCNNIADSDALIVMADAVKAGENLDNSYAMKRELGANIINMIFPDIKKIILSGGRGLTTLVALTKTDNVKIPEMMKRSNFGAISGTFYAEIYSKMFSCMDKDSDSWGVIPVSAVGDGNTDEYNYIIEGANITPKNIDTAILFCLASSITKIISEKESQLKELRKSKKSMWIAIGAQAKEAKQKVEEEIKKAEQQKSALEKCRNALSTMTGKFSESINQMHRPNTAEIGEVVAK